MITCLNEFARLAQRIVKFIRATEIEKGLFKMQKLMLLRIFTAVVALFTQIEFLLLQ